MLDLIIFLSHIGLPLKHSEVDVHAKDYISCCENLAISDEWEPGALDFF